MKKQTKVKYDRMDYHTFTTKDMPYAERRKLDVGDLWMNRIGCKKCGDTITSNNRHDFKYCRCGSVFVDGGSWYGRMGGSIENIIEKFVLFDDVKVERIKSKTKKNMNYSSLSEIALKLKINKSKLAYYFNMGLLIPMAKVGRMNVFDFDKTVKVIKEIAEKKKQGKSLIEIRNKK